MSRRIVDSPNALGLATSAGTSDSGLRTVSPAPHARGSTATLLPRSASISTEPALRPTSRSLERQEGPAQYLLPAAST